jgi:hypothetical protein
MEVVETGCGDKSGGLLAVMLLVRRWRLQLAWLVLFVLVLVFAAVLLHSTLGDKGARQLKSVGRGQWGVVPDSTLPGSGTL